MIASRLLRTTKFTRSTSITLFKSNHDIVKRALAEGIPTDVNRIQSTVNVSHVTKENKQPSADKVKMSACGDTDGDRDDVEMEQEEMFVQAHPSFEHDILEWGGPRRGGRFPEPTRFGDWERKGRCTDF